MATYSFLDVVASLVGPGGSISLGSGAGDAEEGITVEMEGDKNTMQIGADGTGQHSLNAANAGTVTIVLLKTSPTNALLQALYDYQTASSSLHGKNTITVVNSESGDTLTAALCAFKKRPALKYAKEAGTNTWAFDAIQIYGVLGSY
jgi:hypothetical protein